MYWKSIKRRKYHEKQVKAFFPKKPYELASVRKRLTIFFRAYDFGIEEFIEAIGFYWFLKFGCMPSQVGMKIFVNFFELVNPR